MRKIILAILIIILVFSLNVIAIDIDIGSPAIDRTGNAGNNRTLISKANPASESGTITSVEIYAVSGYDLINCKVATFEEVSNNTFTTRDTHTIGTVTAGSKQTFPVNLDVQVGDYIGIFISLGDWIEADTTGGSGLWDIAGNYIPCSDAVFGTTNWPAVNMSLYGTGDTITIDIGTPAIVDSSTTSNQRMTFVSAGNPANLSGEIRSVELYAAISLTEVEVATYYIESGNNLSTRDYVYIGDVASGAKRTFEVDLTVEEGDFIGFTYATGTLYRSIATGVGYWALEADQVPCSDVTFDWYTPRSLSLLGTGTTEVGWQHKWNTKTISKWNTKEFTKWNGLE